MLPSNPSRRNIVLVVFSHFVFVFPQHDVIILIWKNNTSILGRQCPHMIFLYWSVLWHHYCVEYYVKTPYLVSYILSWYDDFISWNHESFKWIIIKIAIQVHRTCYYGVPKSKMVAINDELKRTVHNGSKTSCMEREIFVRLLISEYEMLQWKCNVVLSSSDRLIMNE